MITRVVPEFNEWNMQASVINSNVLCQIKIQIVAKTLCGRSQAFQIGSTRKHSKTDAAHIRKAQGQMRPTRQMQIDAEACIRNSTDKIATPETCNSSTSTVISTTLIQRLCGSLCS